MKVKKRNNKGFSLVELIVVILIMAVLAVAIAPNVMQWVDNARLARDKHNYEEMVSIVQEAMTYSGVYSEVNSGAEITLLIQESDNTVTSDDGTTPANFINALDALQPAWKSVKPVKSGNSYYIKIKNGIIERDPNPVLSFAN